MEVVVNTVRIEAVFGHPGELKSGVVAAHIC